MFLLLAVLLHVAPDQKSAADVAHPVVLMLSDAPARETAVTLELIAPERLWSLPVQVKGGKLAVTLVHPPCTCTLRARAEEYAEAVQPLGSENALLLRRLPIIRGVVLDDARSSPLPGAAVSLPDSKGAATTDARGAFRLVVAGAWPGALSVDHPLHAPAVVPVPRAVADTKLPPIRLSSGGTILLAVAPPIGGAEPLRWEIRKDDSSAVVVRSGELAEGTSSVRIERLDPGRYRVLVRGNAPLQQFARRALVAAGQLTEATALITPLVVDGRVTFDGAPLSSATVRVSPEDRAWTAELTTDEEGRFAEEVWQTGAYKLSVTREPVVRIWGTDRAIEGEGRVPLELNVPNRRIRGRVVDARTGAPIADALVRAEMKFGEHAAISNRTRTAADGSFEFTGVEAGSVTLTAHKTGYRFDRPVAFVLGETESLRDEHLVLEELPVARTVVVTDGRGMPVVDALVFHGSTSVTSTDARGRAVIHFASPDPRGMVFVVPRSGSLGFAPIAGEGEVAVRVLDNAALDLRIESTAGEPIPRAVVMLRINGTTIPSEVVAMMAYLQGFPLSSDAAGRLSYPRMPPGQYELIPIAGRSRSAPVRVAVLPGAQTVVMQFAPAAR